MKEIARLFESVKLISKTSKKSGAGMKAENHHK